MKYLANKTLSQDNEFELPPILKCMAYRAVVSATHRLVTNKQKDQCGYINTFILLFIQTNFASHYPVDGLEDVWIKVVAAVRSDLHSDTPGDVAVYAVRILSSLTLPSENAKFNPWVFSNSSLIFKSSQDSGPGETPGP